MDRRAGDRARAAGGSGPSTPPNNKSVSLSVSNMPLTPGTGSLRARRFPSPRVVRPDSNVPHRNSFYPHSGGPAAAVLTRTESQEFFGTSPAMPALLQHRHHGDPIVSLVGRHSTDSMADLGSTTSPTSQSPALGFPFYASKDSVNVQDFYTMHHHNHHNAQQQQQQHLTAPKGVSIVYPHLSSPVDPYGRAVDYASARGMSVTEEDANEDRVQVRVEGYYESNGVGVLIPNDLPPSTLLYVLTASDGRDLMFKLIQYGLQLTICFLKTPSLFSPGVQVLMGPMAERLYRNYNTIRHGRSLFKMGRGLLNLFTLQTVCERMWLRYEHGIARAACAVLLPVVSRLEQGALLLGASPLWGRYVSCRLLRWVQAVQASPGHSRCDDIDDPSAPEWRAQHRLRDQQQQQQQQSTAVVHGTLLADDMFVHVAEAERAAAPTATREREAKTAHGNSSSGIGRTLRRVAGYAGGAVVGAGAHASAQSAFPLTAEDSRTNTSAEQSEQQSPTTGSGSAGSAGVGGLPLLPRVPSRTLSTGSTSPASWGGHVSSGLTTAAPTPSAAAAKRNSTSGGPASPPPCATGTLPLSVELELQRNAQPPSTLFAATAPDALGPPPTTAAATMTATNTTAAAAAADGVGRRTLLHPLKRLTKEAAETADDSASSDEARDRRPPGADSSVTHNGSSSMMPVARSPSSFGSVTTPLMPEMASGGGLMPGEGPLSVPNHWQIACAPTVPPSQSDELVLPAPTLPYPVAGSFSTLRLTTSSTSTAAPLPCTSTVKSSSPSTSTPLDGADAGRPVHLQSPASTAPAEVSITTQPPTRRPTDADETPPHGGATAGDRPSTSNSRNRCPAFVFTTAAAAAAPPSDAPRPAPHMATPTNTSSSPNDPNSKARDDSEVSLLSSGSSSSLHAQQNIPAHALSTWLREPQPASAALPVRWRKGVLQFSPLLMALLGLRNFAAACRRFLRDATLVSTERLLTVPFVEVHRHAITRLINRCWFVVSVIDLLLNTVRLLQPGWVKYATARQNIHCRCGCHGDDDPADMVWRTHGFIARRKTDLVFPPLDLDYGAPFVSSLAYVEAADPARLMPACSRCGFLYREVPSDSESETDAADGAGRGAAAAPRAAHGHNASLSAPATAGSLSDDGWRVDGHRGARGSTGAVGVVEREKPRWVQLYNEEVQLGESQRLRSPGGRRETQRPSTEETHATPAQELGARRSSNTVVGGTGDGLAADAVRQRRRSTAAPPPPPQSAASPTGILFVPWLMRKFFDYVWLLRVHPNLTSTVLLEARCIAELYLSYKYCFGGFETFTADAPLSAVLHPCGAVAGIVSASVGLLRVMESAPAV
ncbi:hypothetical protein NESM_000379400 [Novymonas esmeraldas]|uniref:Uncharacterized protein n=1 Tax=Novymonas esmeraldas TaxID=1808958 RepID=A0AAW0EN05_9TRYP